LTMSTLIIWLSDSWGVVTIINSSTYAVKHRAK
jgi:hypothetical protein